MVDLRARLPCLGIPVRRSVKVEHWVTYGMHPGRLPALFLLSSFLAEGEQQAA
ncbi:hypothetical protein [Streptomyces sp. ML-6]|uniref:hypothetical protein n=1 Tax=Streptomyces sp. ML-6 TaxID=2982693 RepID=UPI0024C0703E|nr:hypothetical protein [Streptomyces sp. ML-6]MDK0524323.1 hypothetical protein [Streptomyces sp. ML-6]